MQSIGNYAAHIKRQKASRYRLHRRAMRHNTTPQQRALRRGVDHAPGDGSAALDLGGLWTGRERGAAGAGQGSTGSAPVAIRTIRTAGIVTTDMPGRGGPGL